jgi:hypothetical protein
MMTVDPHEVTPEWAARGVDEVPELLGVASYVCPPEDASARELERAAAAVSDWSDADPVFIERGCRVARRRLADGKVRRDVLRLLEQALRCARDTKRRGIRPRRGIKAPRH